MLRGLDLLVILAYLVLALGVGVLFARRAGRSGESYFLADRNLPGWVVGLSIVATTFAADTPLAVSGMVASKGIAANWFWWSLGIAHVGMFLFWSRLWRRSGVITDAELVEVRYGGASGAMLRSAKACYFALVYNSIVLGWVIAAMQKIAGPFARWGDWLPSGVWSWFSSVWPEGLFGGPDQGLTILLMVGLAATYSTLGGLRGVVVTDVIQLVLAAVGAVALAWFGLEAVGGLDGLLSGLRSSLSPQRYEEVLRFVPPQEGLSFLPLQAFAVYLLIRWWATPMGDGGGYIAQRLMAARSPEDARQAAGIFVVLHYIMRPWPWLLVGLIGLVVFPMGNEASRFAVGALVEGDREMAYPALASVVLKPGMLGLLLASLLAAFMSTVDTHLNWGVSYIANDLWTKRFRPEASPREVVRVGRVASLLFAALALVAASQIDSVEQAWKFVAGLGSGLGLPVLLRWVWWRANAEAEIWGALASFAVTCGLSIWGTWELPLFGTLALPWEYSLLLAVTAAAVASFSALWIYGPSDEETLLAFYRRVRPPGWWGPVRAKIGQEVSPGTSPGRMALAWLLGACGLMAGIFAPGHLLLGHFPLGVAELALALILGFTAFFLVRDEEEGVVR